MTSRPSSDVPPIPRWKIVVLRTLAAWGIIFWGGLGIVGVVANEIWPTVPNLLIAAVLAYILWTTRRAATR